MTLLSLLAALLVKETVSVSEFWREQRPLQWYLTQLERYQHKAKGPVWLYLVGVIVAPTIVLFVLLFNLPSLLSLLLSTAVLFLCLQDGDTKAHFKHIMRCISMQKYCLKE